MIRPLSTWMPDCVVSVANVAGGQYHEASNRATWAAPRGHGPPGSKRRAKKKGRPKPPPTPLSNPTNGQQQPPCLLL